MYIIPNSQTETDLGYFSYRTIQKTVFGAKFLSGDKDETKHLFTLCCVFYDIQLNRAMGYFE